MAVKKTTVKKTKDGTVDKRTKEGKEIASALGIDDARAVLMLADLVKDEPKLQIEL